MGLNWEEWYKTTLDGHEWNMLNRFRENITTEILDEIQEDRPMPPGELAVESIPVKMMGLLNQMMAKAFEDHADYPNLDQADLIYALAMGIWVSEYRPALTTGLKVILNTIATQDESQEFIDRWYHSIEKIIEGFILGAPHALEQINGDIKRSERRDL